MAEGKTLTFRFHKMHGAGNDFILFDDRSLAFPSHDQRWLQQLAARRTGIGSDGIILIQPSQRADFRMRFFNPDGREAEMCGNGVRCATRLAVDLGIASGRVTVETSAGILKAEVKDRMVRTEMIRPRDWHLNHTMKVLSMNLTCHSVNTGVPHVVIEWDNLDHCDVDRLGAAVRHHQAFAPEGTNVNFVTITGPHSLRVRTYERGVEGETLACGTGVVAAALVAGRLNRVTSPVMVETAGGHILTVEYDLHGESVGAPTLTGPVENVFEGVVTYPAGDQA
ncbi:MAG: diaminopimelate epimerase [Kiritimatiellae bacterium]|nr:diaminopimelate epimerase [Kiritimatiellia bacterium]